MNTINLFQKATNPKHILCLGAHCDDIEIGAGGTLLRLQEEYPQLQVHWVVFSSNEQRAAETRASASHFIKINPAINLTVLTFRESYFPYIGLTIKEYFGVLKNQYSPDLILTHYHKDVHQDHRLISELTWNTFRQHLILEYMIPKYEGESGIPNLFINLSHEIIEKKVDIIFNSYQSQQDKHWFSKDTFLAVMRLRGIESHSSSGYAEGFFARKISY